MTGNQIARKWQTEYDWHNIALELERVLCFTNISVAIYLNDSDIEDNC
jgi:hypothetical protein